MNLDIGQSRDGPHDNPIAWASIGPLSVVLTGSTWAVVWDLRLALVVVNRDGVRLIR